MNKERDVTHKDGMSSRTAMLWVAVILLVVMVVVPIYFYFDPAHSYLAPKCPFRMLTGLDCPSCGNQRALHSLLNGDVWLSIRYNPFFWIAGPYFILIIYSTLFRSNHAKRLYNFLSSYQVIWTFVALYFIWWIVRNLPFWHNLVDLPY